MFMCLFKRKNVYKRSRTNFLSLLSSGVVFASLVGAPAWGQVDLPSGESNISSPASPQTTRAPQGHHHHAGCNHGPSGVLAGATLLNVPDGVVSAEEASALARLSEFLFTDTAAYYRNTGGALATGAPLTAAQNDQIKNALWIVAHGGLAKLSAHYAAITRSERALNWLRHDFLTHVNPVNLLRSGRDVLRRYGPAALVTWLSWEAMEHLIPTVSLAFGIGDAHIMAPWAALGHSHVLDYIVLPMLIFPIKIMTAWFAVVRSHLSFSNIPEARRGTSWQNFSTFFNDTIVSGLREVVRFPIEVQFFNGRPFMIVPNAVLRRAQARAPSARALRILLDPLTVAQEAALPWVTQGELEGLTQRVQGNQAVVGLANLRPLLRIGARHLYGAGLVRAIGSHEQARTALEQLLESRSAAVETVAGVDLAQSSPLGGASRVASGLTRGVAPDWAVDLGALTVVPSQPRAGLGGAIRSLIGRGGFRSGAVVRVEQQGNVALEPALVALLGLRPNELGPVLEGLTGEQSTNGITRLLAYQIMLWRFEWRRLNAQFEATRGNLRGDVDSAFFEAKLGRLSAALAVGGVADRLLIRAVGLSGDVAGQRTFVQSALGAEVGAFTRTTAADLAVVRELLQTSSGPLGSLSDACNNALGAG